MKDFKGLEVWQDAHELTLSIYKATGSFPRHELFGLCSQLRRAATSIGSTIAEGCGRGGEVEFNRFLQIAAGSCNEVEYQLLLARDLHYLMEPVYMSLDKNVKSVRRRIAGLQRSIQASRRS